jgi:hypothetical protein
MSVQSNQVDVDTTCSRNRCSQARSPEHEHNSAIRVSTHQQCQSCQHSSEHESFDADDEIAILLQIKARKITTAKPKVGGVEGSNGQFLPPPVKFNRASRKQKWQKA